MRIARLLTEVRGGVSRGVCVRGVWLVGVHPLEPETENPSLCEQNDWQTGVKTLHSRNFVCMR